MSERISGRGKVCLVTGAAGLVGSESVRFFSKRGLQVVGIDNFMRGYFFGESASTRDRVDELCSDVPDYVHHDVDIRDRQAIARIFSEYGESIDLIVHAASQPSHDWAAREPLTDFSINATATVDLLELFREHCPAAKFVFISTNKVYGDSPNRLPLIEHSRRFDLDPSHRYFEHGIDESLSLDQTTHSLFGVSKVAADLMVQEYGRYFGLATACFRAGCITGPAHAGAELHGFLAYLMQCAVTGRTYTIYGYQGKQVRDNIHSFDLVDMFDHYYRAPAPGAVFNAGGGRQASCSVLEAISICEELTGTRMSLDYTDRNRQGDHIWWISDCRRFGNEYPGWSPRHDLKTICENLYTAVVDAR